MTLDPRKLASLDILLPLASREVQVIVLIGKVLWKWLEKEK